MISYAQNGEDVILARALGGSPGFYVDVGAASPDHGSVTRHFSECGWHGINIEPVPAFAAALRKERPRDVTIEAVAGREPGHTTLFLVREHPELSTLSSVIKGWHDSAGNPVDGIEVPVVTLDQVLHDAGDPEVDFLKIDAEGAEPDVLAGLDLKRRRPRVLVIESTVPLSLVPNYQEWEPSVLDARYLFAATDGVNRYYARAEDEDLVELLVPANSLDEYTPYQVHELEQELARLRAHVENLDRGD